VSLHTRLTAGLLAVTGLGLLVMGAVSALVLRGYLMERVDDQLVGARDRAVLRLVRPGLPAEGVAPARYVVLVVQRDGQIRTVSGDDPDPADARAAAARMGRAGLAERADAGPFDLGDTRAVARVQRNGVVVVAAPLADIEAAVRRLVLAELVTGAALVVLLALAGRWLTRRGLAPLDRMAATAHAISTGGDLRARMPPAHGEAGRLAAAINVMLDRIAEAFAARARSEARVRDFAADASHELRTPLTTIQGYAELYRHGALDDLPDAMRRIEEEAHRMSGLVTELLELARLDRGGALHPAPVDLAQLARDAVADTRTLDPAHPVTLEAPDTLVAVVDEARVRQILANLLGNVRAHTPPGTAATVTVAESATAIVLEVSDTGPGMSPADAARAFNRFHRALPPSTNSTGSTADTGSRGGTGGADQETDGGAGLGLAIVEAIARAHGGRALLRAAPGAGTVVRVEFPRAAEAGG
jgi:two-component system, OmpR family, sensor kinase